MDIYLKPNWAKSVRDSFEYRTTIFTSDDGHEQRSAERINARRTVEFETLLTGKALRDTRAKLHSRSDYLCYIPDPTHRLSKVATFAPVGSTSIEFTDAIPADQIGRRICVQGWQRNFFATVASINGSVVTFTAPISGEAKVGDELRPCVSGRMPQTAQMTYLTDDKATFPVSFQQNPGEPNLNRGSAQFPSFEGREVFNMRPNWTNPPAVQLISEYDVTDYNRGIIKTYSPIDFLSKVTQFNFTGVKLPQVATLIDFFHRQMGRLNEFWCPSWTTDLKLVETISSGDTSLTVEGRAVADFYNGSTVETAIAIRMPGDVWHYVGIDSIATDGTTSTITLDLPVNFNVEVGKEIGLYWLNVCRFATDAVTIQWLTDETAQAVFQIKTLEALPAEV